MAFKNGAYATVWEVTPVSDTITRCKISTSRKNKETGQYETDFSNPVGFIGTAVAQQAMKLKERDRIRLDEVSVTSKYNKEKNTMFYNFNIFSFEKMQNNYDNNAYSGEDPQPKTAVDDGEVDDSALPF